ncbi:MAG: hypothetical protein H7Y10_03770 [Flavobacterium sp.]|nr:hypothetical protein [Flavobacterium sp.]
MEDNHYKVDIAELQEQQQNRVVEAISVIEQKCSLPSVQFLKSNLENKKIRDRQTEPDIKTLIGVMFAKIGALSGIKNEIDSMIAQDIMKMIFNAYGNLTIEEIYKAFELERYGSFEDKTPHFQMIDADYVAKILKKYIQWRHNIKMQHNITSDTLKLDAITESQKETIVKEGVNQFYQQYKTNKTIEDPSEYVFDFLVQKGIIKTNNNPKVLEYYQMQLQKAQQELKKENIAKTSTDKLERQTLKTDLNKITAGHSPKIILRAKKNILAEFFENQILLKTEKIF